jgi:hypothetical protein
LWGSQVFVEKCSPLSLVEYQPLEISQSEWYFIGIVFRDDISGLSARRDPRIGGEQEEKRVGHL